MQAPNLCIYRYPAIQECFYGYLAGFAAQPILESLSPRYPKVVLWQFLEIVIQFLFFLNFSRRNIHSLI